MGGSSLPESAVQFCLTSDPSSRKPSLTLPGSWPALHWPLQPPPPPGALLSAPSCVCTARSPTVPDSCWTGHGLWTGGRACTAEEFSSAPPLPASIRPNKTPVLSGPPPDTRPHCGAQGQGVRSGQGSGGRAVWGGARSSVPGARGGYPPAWGARGLEGPGQRVGEV